MAKGIKLKTGNNNVYTESYYAIGDLFFTTNAENPSTRLGGTWELFGPGRGVVCVNVNDADFNSVKKTGGSKYIQNHGHVLNGSSGNFYVTEGGVGRWINFPQDTTSPYHSYATTIVDTGTGGALSTGNSGNLAPFITCYIWIRTA